LLEKCEDIIGEFSIIVFFSHFCIIILVGIHKHTPPTFIYIYIYIYITLQYPVLFYVSLFNVIKTENIIVPDVERGYYLESERNGVSLGEGGEGEPGPLGGGKD
jgi:hypothetical protein